MIRYRVYCGPTVVERAAENLRAQGVQVDVVGTMHVYISSEKPVPELIQNLAMSGFTWRDFEKL